MKNTHNGIVAMLKRRAYTGIFFVWIAGMALTGCATEGDTSSQSETGFPGDSWPVSSPETEGIDPAAIQAIHADMEAGKYGLIDHFLLIRNGRIVADYRYERDYASIAADYDTTNHQYNYDHPDWHPYYRDTELHTMQSVTKSVTSAALGIAIDEGMLQDVATPAMAMFEGYEQDFTDPRREAVKLEDLLTMRSGIDWNEMISYADSTNSCILMEASDEWIQFVLDQPMREDPGTIFDYNSGASVLLGKLVRVGTGMRIDDWAREKLFEPIGIDEFYWKITPDGEVDTEGGLYLTTHDLARIGYLFLRRGKWEDRQVISESWALKSTSPVVSDTYPEDDDINVGYGYQWWVPNQENGETEIFAANGYGGQFLLVAPDYDIVAVFNGWNTHEAPEMSTWRTLQERILPAVNS